MSSRSLDYATKYPALARRRQLLPSKPPPDFTTVTLGNDHNGIPVRLDETPRLEQMHVIGSTGSGKTTLLKALALADFRRGRGGIIIDPHGSHPGSLYHEVLGELEADGFCNAGRVHILDPNIRSHLLTFNPLAPIDDTDLSVIADALLQAFERAWGDEDTHDKPTIRKILKATFIALAELGLSLIDGPLLYDPHDQHGVRERAIAKLTNEFARDALAYLHQTALDERSKRDFRAEVIGPINRLAEFTSCEAIRAMLGVVDEPGGRRRTFDILGMMDRGGILVCNLQHGAAVSEADTDLLGALLLRYVFLLASRRTNREPFFIYADECHRYLTGDVPSILAETRKYGIAGVWAHQYTAQLGQRDSLIYQALLNSTEIKCVFRVKSPEEAQRLAEMVIPLTLERPVQASVRPAVVGQRRVKLASESSSRSTAVTEGGAETVGEMHATTEMHSHSDGVGTMSATMTGVGTFEGAGDSSGMVLSPPLQLLGPNAPNASYIQFPLSESMGQSRSRGSSEQSATSRGESRMSVDAHGEAQTLAHSRATTRSVATSHGRSETTGHSEGFESIFADLPASFHSKENELYFAGELIRSLPVGRAFVSWRGKTHCITIPPPKRKS